MTTTLNLQNSALITDVSSFPKDVVYGYEAETGTSVTDVTTALGVISLDSAYVVRTLTGLKSVSALLPGDVVVAALFSWIASKIQGNVTQREVTLEVLSSSPSTTGVLRSVEGVAFPSWGPQGCGGDEIAAIFFAAGSSASAVDMEQHMIIKQGDTFDYLTNIPATFADGYFVGWQVNAQIRAATSGTLIASLDVPWVVPATTRTLRLYKLGTSGWPVGQAEFDIQFTRPDGYVMSTRTVSLTIVKDVTQP